MKTCVLDQIINDTELTKEELIIDLRNNPEGFNCVTLKSYDEMTSDERERVYNAIESYISSNM